MKPNEQALAVHSRFKKEDEDRKWVEKKKEAAELLERAHQKGVSASALNEETINYFRRGQEEFVELKRLKDALEVSFFFIGVVSAS
jgi:hypothetical protein